MNPAEFDDATYRQVFAFMRGVALRRKHEYRLTLFGAWHTEAFARQKRLTPFTDIVKRMDAGGHKKAMTLKEQHAAVKQIAQAFGAKVVYKKKAK